MLIISTKKNKNQLYVGYFVPLKKSLICFSRPHKLCYEIEIVVFREEIEGRNMFIATDQTEKCFDL